MKRKHELKKELEGFWSERILKIINVLWLLYGYLFKMNLVKMEYWLDTLN